MKLKVVILPLSKKSKYMRIALGVLKSLTALGVLKSLTETEVITNLPVKLLSIPLWQKFTNNFYS